MDFLEWVKIIQNEYGLILDIVLQFLAAIFAAILSFVGVIIATRVANSHGAKAKPHCVLRKIIEYDLKDKGNRHYYLCQITIINGSQYPLSIANISLKRADRETFFSCKTGVLAERFLTSYDLFSGEVPIQLGERVCEAKIEAFDYINKPVESCNLRTGYFLCNDSGNRLTLNEGNKVSICIYTAGKRYKETVEVPKIESHI